MLYFGQSARYFELQPGMVWPDGSWLFSKLLGENGNRTLASVLLVLAAIGFVAAGIGVFASQPWWHLALVGSAVFSSAIFLLFWDGSMQQLANKGGVGILINLAILIALYGFHWPNFDF
jgi:hypothetical protein